MRLKAQSLDRLHLTLKVDSEIIVWMEKSGSPVSHEALLLDGLRYMLLFCRGPLRCECLMHEGRSRLTLDIVDYYYSIIGN
jgi:hypothetical protein